MSANESITNLPDAVRELGALPVPVGPEPRALSVERLAEIAAELGHVEQVAAEATGWRLEDYRAVRGALHSARLLVTEAGLLRARVAELEALAGAATEYRVWEPGYGLYVRRAPGATGFAILEARRTDQGRRAWTTAGLRYAIALSDAELYCWPDAESAVSEARRVLPGAVVREDEAPGSDAVTRVFSPVASLREPEGEPPLSFAERADRESDPGRRAAWRMLAQDMAEGEHFAAVHHDYRVSHDLPETGGVQ